jgi:hypothetical protein
MNSWPKYASSDTANALAYGRFFSVPSFSENVSEFNVSQGHGNFHLTDYMTSGCQMNDSNMIILANAPGNLLF